MRSVSLWVQQTCLIHDDLPLPFFTAVLADLNKLNFNLCRVCDDGLCSQQTNAPGICFGLLHLLGRHPVLLPVLWHVSIVF